MSELLIEIGDRKYTLSRLKLFLDAALAIKAGKLEKCNGICSNMDAKVYAAAPDDSSEPDADDWIRAVVDQWPEWSGRDEEIPRKRHELVSYPVPHPVRTPKAAYYHEPLWDRRTTYGKARMRLLDWLIDRLVTTISEHEHGFHPQ